ncbi:asparagine synthase-related protein [Natronococcus amylolyticus]|uniref:asparagine synthase-related protein n=1 Tax=Natronococcus amylolyticus TaxID=44470 RepID=UPI0006781078|nr:asparagine synthase-related protein [Natronococcus amylolyticus]
MPGTTIVRCCGGNAHEQGRVDRVLDSVCFTESYDRETVVRNAEGTVASTGYDTYPTEVVETDEWTILLEGRIYDRRDTEAALRNVAAWIDEGNVERLSEWVATRDGDFLITVVDRASGSTWVVNDVFGRLPTYRTTVGDTTIVTRELKVARRLAAVLEGRPVGVDRLGLGQMLLFGYPLGTRTPFDGIRQLPPGSLLEVERDEVTSLHEFRFDRYENDDRSVAENARALTDRFVEACRRRAGTVETSIVSLSGGLDSRAAIAGYDAVLGRASGGTLLAATSVREDGANADEANVARKVAHSLDVPWSSYFVDRTERHRKALLEMTQGMNTVGMSLGLDFAEQLAADHPGAALVTGDGGDKIFPDLTPPTAVDSRTELVETLVRTNQQFAPDEIEDVIGLDADRLVDSVAERIDAYSEATLEGAHVHFLIRERGINMLNHGEDRTRHHLWTTTPFYAPDLFAAAMACPPEQKAGTELYREFLSLLSRELAEIEYVDFGVPITSVEYRAKKFAYGWLGARPALKERVRSLVESQGSGGGIHSRQLLAEAVADADGLGRHFSAEEIQRIAWDGSGHRPHQRYQLATLVAALDPIESRVRQPTQARPVMQKRH